MHDAFLGFTVPFFVRLPPSKSLSCHFLTSTADSRSLFYVTSFFWSLTNFFNRTCSLRNVEKERLRLEVWRSWSWPWNATLAAEGEVLLSKLMKNHCTFPATDSRRANQAVTIDLQPVNSEIEVRCFFFPETTSPVHWRSLLQAHTTKLGALQDLLFLMNKDSPGDAPRSEKWTFYCDTETIGLLGEELRQWATGQLPIITQRKRRSYIAERAHISDEESSEDEEEENENETLDISSTRDDELCSPWLPSTNPGHLLPNLVAAIWLRIGEAKKMHAKLASIAFHLFLIDVLPASFNTHPRHTFFLMELMRPYFSLENAYSKQFLLLYCSLLVDTAKDFVSKYEERLPILKGAQEFGASDENGENGLESRNFLTTSSSSDLSIGSSMELKIVPLEFGEEGEDPNESSTLEMSVSLTGGAAPRRRRNKQASMSGKPKKKGESEASKLKMKREKEREGKEFLAFRERARMRFLATLFLQLKYFDPSYIPMLLKTKLADAINSVLDESLPISICMLGYDTVRFIGPPYSNELSTKGCLEKLSQLASKTSDKSLRLSILGSLAQFLPNTPSSSSGESKNIDTTLLQTFISELAMTLASIVPKKPVRSTFAKKKSEPVVLDPKTASIANRFLYYLQSALPATVKLALTFPTCISALFLMFELDNSELHKSALSVLPEELDPSLLLQESIFEVITRFFDSCSPEIGKEIFDKETHSLVLARLISYINLFLTYNWEDNSTNTSSKSDENGDKKATKLDWKEVEPFFDYARVKAIISILNIDCNNSIDTLVVNTLSESLTKLKPPLLNAFVLKGALPAALHRLWWSTPANLLNNAVSRIRILPSYFAMLVKSFELELIEIVGAFPYQSGSRHSTTSKFRVITISAPQGSSGKTLEETSKSGGNSAIFPEISNFFRKPASPIDLELLDLFFQRLVTLLPTNPDTWRLVHRESPEIWKNFGKLLSAILPSTAGNLPSAALAIAKLALAYKSIDVDWCEQFFANFFEPVVLALEVSLKHGRSECFLNWIQCIGQAFITPLSSDRVMENRLKRKNSQSGQISPQDPRYIPPMAENDALCPDYIKMRKIIGKREPVVLETDFLEAWETSSIFGLPPLPPSLKDSIKHTKSTSMTDIYDFTSSSSQQKDEEYHFSSPSAPSTSIALSAATSSSSPFDTTKVLVNDSSKECLEDDTELFLPNRLVALLSHFVYEWIESRFETISGVVKPTISADQWEGVIRVAGFLASNDFWFREKWFSHDDLWTLRVFNRTTEQLLLHDILRRFIRDQALDRTICKIQNVPFFVRLLTHAPTQWGSSIPSALIYHLFKKWSVSKGCWDAVASESELSYLSKMTFEMPCLSEKQTKKFVELWLHTLEPSLDSLDLPKAFKMIQSFLSGKHLNSAASARIYDLFLKKLNATLEKHLKEGVPCTLDTSLAFTVPKTIPLSSGLLSRWISLWRPGNITIDLNRAYAPDISSLDPLRLQLSPKEMSRFFYESSFVTDPQNIWRWIDYEKDQLELERLELENTANNGKGIEESKSNKKSTQSPKKTYFSETSEKEDIANGKENLNADPQGDQCKAKEKTMTNSEKEIREFTLRRFYQAEFIATVLQARGNKAATFSPGTLLSDDRIVAGNWPINDPLLRLMVGAFGGAMKITPSYFRSMHACKWYATLVVEEVARRREFLEKKHPLIILAVLQTGVFPTHLKYEYELYASLIPIYRAVKIEPLRASRILKDMARCAFRNPEKFVQHVPKVSEIVIEALKSKSPDIVEAAASIISSLAIQFSTFVNDDLIQAILPIMFSAFSSAGLPQRKLNATLSTILFAWRHGESQFTAFKRISQDLSMLRKLKEEGKGNVKSGKKSKTAKREEKKSGKFLEDEKVALELEDGVEDELLLQTLDQSEDISGIHIDLDSDMASVELKMLPKPLSLQSSSSAPKSIETRSNGKIMENTSEEEEETSIGDSMGEHSPLLSSTHKLDSCSDKSRSKSRIGSISTNGSLSSSSSSSSKIRKFEGLGETSSYAHNREEEEWFEVLLSSSVQTRGQEQEEEDGILGVASKLQLCEYLSPLLKNSSSEVNSFAHAITHWSKSSQIIQGTLNFGDLHSIFDGLVRHSSVFVSHLITRSIDQEQDILFWSSIARGIAAEGEPINNGPVVGRVFALLCALPYSARRQVFFSSIEPPSSSAFNGDNMITKIFDSASGWVPYSQIAGVVDLSFGLLLLKPIAEDLLSAKEWNAITEKWNLLIAGLNRPQTQHPLFQYVAENLGGRAKYTFTDDQVTIGYRKEKLEVDFFGAKSPLSATSRDTTSPCGYAVATHHNTIYALPYERPVHARIGVRLDRSSFEANKASEFVLVGSYSPAMQAPSVIRLGCATDKALRLLDSHFWNKSLGEVQGSCSAEQRTGIIMSNGAYVATEKSTSSTRPFFVLRVNFEQKTLTVLYESQHPPTSYVAQSNTYARGLDASMSVWNLDTGDEALWPVISFESSGCVSLAHYWVPSKLASIEEMFHEAVPTEIRTATFGTREANATAMLARADLVAYGKLVPAAYAVYKCLNRMHQQQKEEDKDEAEELKYRKQKQLVFSADSSAYPGVSLDRDAQDAALDTVAHQMEAILREHAVRGLLD